MICPECGHENKENAKFCNECGKALIFPHLESGVSLSSDTESVSTSSDDLHKTAELDLPPVFESDDISSDPLLSDEFDFSPIDDGVGTIDGGFFSEATEKIDTDGFDEYLIDASYTPPQSSWKSGGTMEMPRVEGDEQPKQVEFRAPEVNTKRGKGKIIAIASIFAVLLIALAIAGVTYQMELWGGKSLPNVEGYDKAEATQVLEDIGFVVKVMEVKSDDKKDKVLLMDPGPGRRLHEGSEVVLQVAIPRIIPEAKGKPISELKASLDLEGFTNIEYREVKSNEARDTVLSISPESGTEAQSTTKIIVEVAIPYTVPDVIGKTADEARSMLEGAGYVVEEWYIYNDEVDENTIIETDPAFGTEHASGSTVIIKIAKHRGPILIDATWDYLAQKGTLGIDESSYYEIQSVSDVWYVGEGVTQALVNVVGVTTILGTEARTPATQITVTITWNTDNQIEDISY